MNLFRLADGSKRQERARESQTNSGSRGRGESEARVPLRLAPLTGRDTELSLLKDRWEQAQEGMGQVVLVIGEAGLGKSRLVQTVAQRVQAHGSDVALEAAGESASASVDHALIEWRCSEQFQNSELYPVVDYLERSLGTGRDPSPTARFDRLAQHLDACDLGRPEVVALFAKLLLLPPDERYSVAGLTPPREREETFCALREWLLAYSRKRSVLFVVEDLHWIDASSLEFLKQFISEGAHDRILTVLTFRPEVKTLWPALAHQTNLALNRLTRRQVAEWMRRDAGEVLPEALVAQIYNRTSGVPLLVEEFSRLACESAMFEPARIASSPGTAASARELPATLQELVMAGHLSEEQKEAVTSILKTRDRVFTFRGVAGAGKTTTLREVQRGLNELSAPLLPIVALEPSAM
jgi:predicted ATPase